MLGESFSESTIVKYDERRGEEECTRTYQQTQRLQMPSHFPASPRGDIEQVSQLRSVGSPCKDHSTMRKRRKTDCRPRYGA
jgi:hypothetical protein